VDPREDLTAFLDVSDGDAPTLSDDVRIVIVAADFGRELTTAVLWLNRFERMDIRCIRLRPYRFDGHTLLDVEQVIPLREAAEYQVRMRRKEATTRSNRTDGADWSQYIVVNGDHQTEPLRKRRAVLGLVQAVHAAGTSPEMIRSAIVGPRFLDVDGELDGDSLTAAFIARYPKSADNLRRWFMDQPIHEDGRTWVLSNQWGGERAIRTLDALAALAPPGSRIGYKPA
jgi:hypothetical protein